MMKPLIHNDGVFSAVRSHLRYYVPFGLLTSERLGWQEQYTMEVGVENMIMLWIDSAQYDQARPYDRRDIWDILYYRLLLSPYDSTIFSIRRILSDEISQR